MSLLLQNIINNNYSKEEIINIYNITSSNFKKKIKKILVFKKIFNIYIKIPDNNKINFLALLIIKIKNKFNKSEYISNIRYLKKIFKIDNIMNKKIKKEIFNNLPIELKNIIKKKNRDQYNLRFFNMSKYDKKIYFKLKKERAIRKYGIDTYRELIKEKYYKWYNNLSEEKKQLIKNKRNLKYKNLSFDKKQVLLKQQKIYYQNLSNEKKQLYKLNKLNKNLNKNII